MASRCMKTKLYSPRNVAKAFALALAGKVCTVTHGGKVQVWFFGPGGRFDAVRDCATLPPGASCFFPRTVPYAWESHSPITGGITFRAPSNLNP
jgi:hypothetical protein